MKKILSSLLAAAAVLGCSAGLSSGIFAKEASDLLVPYKKYGITVNRDKGIIEGIPGTVTADELCAMFEGGSSLTVTGKDGSEITGDSRVPSGAKLNAGEEWAYVVIYGDTDGNGSVNISDVSSLLKKIAGWNVSIDENSADVDLNEKINLSDASMVLKKIADWRVYLGGTGMEIIDTPQTAANEDSSLTLSFGNGIDKYTPDSDIGDNVTTVMYSAKNEIEFTQFSIAAESEHSGLTVKYTPFTNAKGETIRTEMFHEKYLDMAGKVKYYDVLEPFVNDFKIKAGAHQPFGIKAYPDENSSYGLYESEIKVIDSDGRELKKALVYLNVWDFELPDASYCRTSFGLSQSMIYNRHNQNTDDDNALYKAYYDFLLENRMNPVVLPYDFDDERVLEYVDNDKVTSFLAGGEGYGGQYNRTDEQIKTAYSLLSQNEEWLKKAYFYFDDEPIEIPEKPPISEQFDSIRTHYEYARTLFPGAKNVVPNHYNYDYGDTDIVGFVMKYSSILCPHTWMFTDPASTDTDVWYTSAMVEKYGSLKDRINEKLASDPTAEFWWYTSDNPKDTYCNLTTSKPGIENRTLFWQQYLYDADGFLYWMTNEWNHIMGFSYIGDEYCGLLVYPGSFYKSDSPVGCVRMELCRDGIEDFDYLHMIEEKFGKDTADEFVSRITTDLRKYNTDSSVLYEVRREMGELLQGWN